MYDMYIYICTQTLQIQNILDFNGEITDVVTPLNS